MYARRKAPAGKWCENDCPHLGKVIGNDGRKLWCLEYGREITNRDETEGKYHKCAECLRDTK